jgi:hypothetical protein
MPPRLTATSALAALTLACFAPCAAAAADDHNRTTEVLGIVPDDSTMLKAHANLPDPRGGAVDDDCLAAARASNGGDEGTIVVCSHGGDGTSQRVSASKSVDESTRTGVPRAPDLSGPSTCLGPCITIPFGHVPPPVYYIDLKSIPEAPKGSDAWKIGQGELRSR